jgi:Na+/H+ antiporter NhaD/arsenite permease-like protein
LDLNPVPYLLALMGAVNTGSLMTPTGNPQNILVASLSGISYLGFLAALWPVALLGLALQVLLLALLYPEVRSLKPLPPLPPVRSRVYPALLRKGLLVALGLLLAFLLGYPMAQGAMGGGGPPPLYPQAPLRALLPPGGLGASGDVLGAFCGDRGG